MKMLFLACAKQPSWSQLPSWSTKRTCQICACCLPLIDMADQHLATSAKKSKGFLKHLKKVFLPGSQSNSSSHSNTTTTTTNTEEAAKLRAKYTHFRILVIGRVNAGKTTLLKRVCNTKDDPIYNKVRCHYHFSPRSYRPFTDRSIRPPRYHLCSFL